MSFCGPECTMDAFERTRSPPRIRRGRVGHASALPPPRKTLPVSASHGATGRNTAGVQRGDGSDGESALARRVPMQRALRGLCSGRQDRESEIYPGHIAGWGPALPRPHSCFVQLALALLHLKHLELISCSVRAVLAVELLLSATRIRGSGSLFSFSSYQPWGRGSSLPRIRPFLPFFRRWPRGGVSGRRSSSAPEASILETNQTPSCTCYAGCA